VPIIHVNADDVPRLHQRRASRLCLPPGVRPRRVDRPDRLPPLRHNESDEPAYTQPEMYAKIKNKKRVSALWSERLIAERRRLARGGRAPGTGGLGQPHDAAPGSEGEDRLGSRARRRAQHRRVSARPLAQPRRGHGRAGGAACASSASSSCACREGFTVHPKLVNSSTAAARRWPRAPSRTRSTGRMPRRSPSRSLLTEGTPLRLTGQDTERGTFSQRPHGVARRQDRPDRCARSRACPTRSLRSSCNNSPLSELALHGLRVRPTARRLPRRSCCGRPSSATSSTRRR